MSHGLTVSSVIVMRVSPHGKAKKTIGRIAMPSVALQTMGMLWEISRACTPAAILAGMTFDFPPSPRQPQGGIYFKYF